MATDTNVSVTAPRLDRRAEPQPPRNRVRLFVLVVIAVIALAALLLMTRRREVPVRVATAERATITSAISTNGTVEALEDFRAHAPAPTSVRRVLVQPGDRVRAGQLLVQLEDYQARAEATRAQAALMAAEAQIRAAKTGGTANETQLDKARVELEAAQRNLQALERLQQKGAASAAEVQQARTRVRAAEADIRVLEQRVGGGNNPDLQRAQAQASEARGAIAAANELLRGTNIRASRAGMVYALPVRPGQFVSAGTLLVGVADLSTVQVRAFVDEPEIGRLAPGQKVRVTWDAIPGRVWEGTLTRVPTTVVQRGARNVGEITCTIANPDLKLLPNVNVGVTIITAQRENAIVAPREAVHQHNGAKHVYEVVDGRLKAHEVQTGISNLTSVEIRSGLPENVPVVLGSTTNQPLRDGLAVQVVQR